MTAESWRVAQVVVDRGLGDEGSRGSGYLVAPGLVLTAAHVVAGARMVRVRLDVGQPAEVEVPAEGWWADPAGSIGTDLAVVMIPAAASAGRDVGWARFGRIGDGTAVLAVQAFGFPRFKLRASPGGSEVFRDLEQVTGHAPIAANRRQGTLAVYLDDPPPAAPEHGDPSPWAGMSGAAVWADGRIVAVVAEHHPGEGTGRLTARRIDRAYGQLPEADLGRLVCWLGLPSALGGLADVVPAGPGQLIRSACTEQVLDIAPDALIGRDGELAEWAEFCAGPDRYAWWQAGPWAGKSALASWFVTHPPAGVDVVSFFITGRLAGQADSDAFLDAMIEQLNALAPGGGPAVVPRARMGAWLSLLASAAAQAGERSRRLVVVVDGLDEDDMGAAPARGRPSIASLLPRRLPAGVRVIVTSRPDPGLPDDVPSGHPLRTCVARRLPVSWVAEDLELRAKQELRDLLAGDQTAIDVVGYLAASGGGLTRSDLSARSCRGPGPHLYRYRGPSTRPHRAGERRRPGRRPRSCRGPGPHRLRPALSGVGARRAGNHRGPGRRPGPRVPAGRRGRGSGPHHHPPQLPGGGAQDAGQRGGHGR
jgi:Trypsin-like peptidase domain